MNFLYIANKQVHHHGPASVAFGHDKDLGAPNTAVSMHNHPGHTRRCRRFACILADAPARLAVEVVVGVSFLPDCTGYPSASWLGALSFRPPAGIDPS